jgi:hypothetical protein
MAYLPAKATISPTENDLENPGGGGRFFHLGEIVVREDS